MILIFSAHPSRALFFFKVRWKFRFFRFLTIPPHIHLVPSDIARCMYSNFQNRQAPTRIKNKYLADNFERVPGIRHLTGSQVQNFLRAPTEPKELQRELRGRQRRKYTFSYVFVRARIRLKMHFFGVAEQNSTLPKIHVFFRRVQNIPTPHPSP